MEKDWEEIEDAMGDLVDKGELEEWDDSEGNQEYESDSDESGNNDENDGNEGQDENDEDEGEEKNENDTNGGDNEIHESVGEEENDQNEQDSDDAKDEGSWLHQAGAPVDGAMDAEEGDTFDSDIRTTAVVASCGFAVIFAVIIAIVITRKYCFNDTAAKYQRLMESGKGNYHTP